MAEKVSQAIKKENHQNREKLFKYQTGLLEKEIVSIERKINYYDSYSLIIKGWTLTIWTGIFIWAFQYSYLQFLWISFFPIVLFWTFDAFFKIFQRKHILRSQWIQDFLNFKGYFKKNQINILDCFSKQSLPDDLLIFDTAGRINYGINDDFKKRVDKVSGFCICFFQRYNCTIYTGLITITMIFLAIQEFVDYETYWWVVFSILFPILMIIISYKFHKFGRKYRFWENNNNA